MNRNYFADGDASVKEEDRCPEVELIRRYLRESLPSDPLKFKMFLDMHGHSSKNSIFAFCPLDKDEKLAESFIMIENDIYDSEAGEFERV